MVNCSKYDDSKVPKPGNITTYKVVVAVPKEQMETFKNVARWHSETIQLAQSRLSSAVALDIEWVDENRDDFEAYMEDVANNKDVAAVIGPYHSSNAFKAALACVMTKKTLILPTVSSTELHRLYSGRDFLWILTESDIAQSELLLAEAKQKNAKSVSLIARDDIYGSSFCDWLGFQATEFGLKINQIYEYNSKETLKESILHSVKRTETRAHTKGYIDEVIIFVPSSESDMLYFDVVRDDISSKGAVFPTVLCSDVALSENIVNKVKYPYNGVALSPDPKSGFIEKYKEVFGKYPLHNQAHFYDALSLVTLGVYVSQKTKIPSLNDALETLIQGNNQEKLSWKEMNGSKIFDMLNNGTYPKLSGAVGAWNFSEDKFTSLLHSTYMYWSLRNKEFIPIKYLLTDPKNRETEGSPSWEWETSVYQNFDPNSTDFKYPALNDRWALIVAGSEGWSNYRHQADAHAMYRLLKKHGYKDDNIVLIVADDIAYNQKNIYKGNLHVEMGGDNVYLKDNIDYRLGDISPEDLSAILTGQRSERTPEVISATKNDNVFIFWSGHGSYDKLHWGKNSSFLSAYKFKNMLLKMKEKERFRNLFVLLEACYAGSIAEACIGINGVLFITAANANETSKTDVRDTEMNIWLSNAFTRSFQKAISKNPNIILRDLYYKLAKTTTGSHVTVYNYNFYDNMFTTNMGDFFKN